MLHEGLGGWVGLVFVKFKDQSELIIIAPLNIEAQKLNISAKLSKIFTKLSGYVKIGLLSCLTMFWGVHVRMCNRAHPVAGHMPPEGARIFWRVATKNSTI